MGDDMEEFQRCYERVKDLWEKKGLTKKRGCAPVPKALARSRSPRTPSPRSSSPTSPVQVTIFFQHRAHPNLSICCQPSDTIGNVKAEISQKIGVPTHRIFLGQNLDDSNVICNVYPDILEVGFGILQMEFRFDLTVLSLVGESIIVNVSENDTIDNVKAKIREQSNTDQVIHLVHDGKRISGGSFYDALVDFDITDDSEVTMVLEAPTFPLCIHFVDSLRSLWIDARASDTISDIKAQIQEKTGIDPQLQTLSMHSFVLDDHMTLEQFNIANNVRRIDLDVLTSDTD